MKRLFLIILLLFAFWGMIFPTEKFVVVLDPGHGGRDGGAVRGSYKEKNINLGVALVLGELIEKNMKDVKVVYTRKADAFVALDRRAEIANKAKANLFISIHTNSTAAKRTTASGADTYILGLSRTEENLAVAKRENSVIMLEDDYSTKYEGFDPNSPESYIIFEFMTNKYRDQSLDFAGYIQRDFRNVAKRADRGVREAGFLVLRKTSMPSVLIELGFINNENEAKFLNTKSGQRIMATAIYSGFKEYKRNFDKMQGKVEPRTKREPVIVDAEIVETVSEKDITKIEKTETLEQDKGLIVQSEEKTTTTIILPQDTPRPKKDNTTKEVQSIQSQVKGQVEPATVIDLRADEDEYRVQFLYSDFKLAPNSVEFKGLDSDKIQYYEEKGYKYTYGATNSLREIERTQAEVRKYFKDAFVIKQDKNTRQKKKFYPLTSNYNPSPNIITTTKGSGGRNNITENIKPKETPSSIKKDVVEYRVQFLFSPKKLSENSGAFKGLSPVDYYVENGYKYTYGSSTSMNEILKIQGQVREKFKDAFVVKFKNGERIK